MQFDLRSQWAESQTRPVGTRQTLEIEGMEYGFCWIPSGEFEMGSPESEPNRNDDEILHHVILTRGFWLLETPVTQKLYESVMEIVPSAFKGDDRPVEQVSYDDARTFCWRLTRLLSNGIKATLPTEAQWEYSCRAGTTTPFSFGNSLNGDRANCNGLSPYGTDVKGEYPYRTTSVKKYAPNPWGLFDMHGNVFEWTLDFYGDYPMGDVVDPTGPTAGSSHVCRGGSWFFPAAACRSAYRDELDINCLSAAVGFRILLNYEEQL